MTTTRAIVYGTLVVGTLDALDAVVFFGFRGVAPHRIFQSIAAGLLGRAAFTGGPATVALGVVLHYFIAFVIVAAFVGASRYIPAAHARADPVGSRLRRWRLSRHEPGGACRCQPPEASRRSPGRFSSTAS